MSNSLKIAITVVAYNRLDSLKRLMSSLMRAVYDEDNIDLIMSVDKSENRDIYNYIDTIRWEHGVIHRIYKQENLGLKNHILSCGEYFDKFSLDAQVILEDDLYVAFDFFTYVREAVDMYHECNSLAGISLYSMSRNLQKDTPFIPVQTRYDAYFMKYAQSWGEVWLKHQWKDFINWYYEHRDYNFSNGSIPINVSRWPQSSWLKYHIAYCIECSKYFLYPYKSLSTNFADAGTHYVRTTNKLQVELLTQRKSNYVFPRFEDADAVKYDEFEENESLAACLGINHDDLCVDIYGVKNKVLQKHYLLTCDNCDFKVIRSFALELIPHDMNIIEGLAGNSVFLYDTHIKKKNRKISGMNKQEHLWNFYYREPNLFKYNIPYIYIRQLNSRLLIKCKSLLRKLRSV